MSDLARAASWWAYVARFYARKLWDSLPGPWYVKMILVAICIAIPGPADELILVALPVAWRKIRSRRAARQAAALQAS